MLFRNHFFDLKSDVPKINTNVNQFPKKPGYFVRVHKCIKIKIGHSELCVIYHGLLV